MDEHPSAKLARMVWEAVSSSDTETVSRCCAEDLIWHASGRGSRSGDYRGVDAIFDYLAAIGDAVERFDSRLDHILVGTDLVAVLFHVTGERHDKVLDTDFILLFRVEDGRVSEIWAVPRDQHAVDEFWT